MTVTKQAWSRHQVKIWTVLISFWVCLAALPGYANAAGLIRADHPQAPSISISKFGDLDVVFLDGFEQRPPSPPMILTGSSVMVEENQQIVVDLEGSDPNGDTEGSGLTYTLAGGDDAAAFSINPNNGVLSFVSVPDYENPLDADLNNVFFVEVTLTDSGGLADNVFLAVTVTNVINSVGVGDLIITEAMGNPSAVSDGDGEWFEFQNQSNETLNLIGLTVSDSGASFDILADVLVEAGEFVVLGTNGDLSLNGGIEVDYVYGAGLTLNNSGDTLAVLSGLDIIDFVDFESLIGPFTSGVSTALDSEGVWCNSIGELLSGDFGSPGVGRVAPCP